jgi:hypothetical protein
MTPRNPGRVRAMTPSDVQVRAGAARKFLEVAQMVADEDDSPDFRQVCASLAVLAGIAAGDAICGHVLKHRSSAQDHRQAADLLRTVAGGRPAAKAVDQLLDIKNAAQYGTDGLPADKTRSALSAAENAVATMEEILLRR